MIEQGIIGCDAAFVQVSPADAEGFHSFGPVSDHVRAIGEPAPRLNKVVAGARYGQWTKPLPRQGSAAAAPGMNLRRGSLAPPV